MDRLYGCIAVGAVDTGVRGTKACENPRSMFDAEGAFLFNILHFARCHPIRSPYVYFLILPLI